MDLVINYKTITAIIVIIQIHSSSANSGYIDCTHGTLNVILAAPHGGYEMPPSVPDRDAGCYNKDGCIWNHNCGVKDTTRCKATVVRDSFTKELTELIADNLESTLGQRPTTVINNLSRLKLDANRDLDQATFGEAIPSQAWHEFHACINESKSRIESNTSYSGMGLFIDIHGHGHLNNWAELGYLFTGSNLDDNNITPSLSSIRNLATVFQGNFETVLRGNKSFGHYLTEEGFTAVPSPTHPGPSGESYFSGGYNTRYHGSINGGKIDAIQIESSYTNRLEGQRPAYAIGISNAILKYLAANYPSTKHNDMVVTDTETSYILCTPGSLNVILAAPHGGYSDPDSIPNRDTGCYVNGACVWSHNCGVKDTTNCGAVIEGDSFTKELTELVADNLEQSLGLRPTTVINNLKRIKLDANREIGQATFGDPIATKAWGEFHACINNAKAKIETDSSVDGMGLFFDMHGQSFRPTVADLGYMISSNDLETNNIEPANSSLRHLASVFQGDFESILRGNKSFGYYLEKEGYNSVPSPSYPNPNGHYYFSGGHNVELHGSLHGGKIDGIMFESAITYRQQAHRSDYARAVANAMLNFRKAHYSGSNSKDTVINGCETMVYAHNCFSTILCCLFVILGFIF